MKYTRNTFNIVKGFIDNFGLETTKGIVKEVEDEVYSKTSLYFHTALHHALFWYILHDKSVSKNQIIAINNGGKIGFKSGREKLHGKPIQVYYNGSIFRFFYHDAGNTIHMEIPGNVYISNEKVDFEFRIKSGHVALELEDE